MLYVVKGFLVAQLVKICLQCRRPQFNSWVRKICWRRDRLPSLVFLGFPCGSSGKESACNAGDLGSIPGLERSPGKGKGYSLQYSGLENSMACIVHGVTKSQTRLSDFTFTFHFVYLRRKWQPPPVFAWKIPGTGEPGGLPSMGSHRVGHY